MLNLFGQNTDSLPEELLGICKGIVADDVVNGQEAAFLLQWIESNAGLIESTYAIKTLFFRLREVLEDGDFTSMEGREVLRLIHDLILPTQQRFATNIEIGTSTRCYPTENKRGQRHAGSEGLELVNPRTDIFDEVEAIDFTAAFCFTGVFALGPRGECERATAKHGATILNNPLKSRKVYVVVGAVASPEWKYGNYGNKIETAMKYRKDGAKTFIISEDVWADALYR